MTSKLVTQCAPLIMGLSMGLILGCGSDKSTAPVATKTIVEQSPSSNSTPSSPIAKAALGFSGGCGLSGTISERLTNCNFQKGPTFAKMWQLVSRRPGKELWLSPSRVLWSHRIGGLSTGLEADDACKDSVTREMDLPESMVFRLPSIEEYQKADAEGIRAILSDMKHKFWTSSSFERGETGEAGNTYSKYQYNGATGNKDGFYAKMAGFAEDAVRCVYR